MCDRSDRSGQSVVDYNSASLIILIPAHGAEAFCSGDVVVFSESAPICVVIPVLLKWQ